MRFPYLFFFQVLQTSYTHKNLVKCREYLRQVTLGLSANQYISFENLFIYIYGTTSESIPQLLPPKMTFELSKEKNYKVRKKKIPWGGGGGERKF